MTTVQRVIKYCAIAFAAFLTVSIIGGILGGLAGVSFLFGTENIVGEMQTYDIGQGFSELEIEVSATALDITTGDTFSLESNLKNLTVNEKNGKLIIKQKNNSFNVQADNASLKIIIPADFSFEKADILTGAGKVTVENLTAKSLQLELGAGEVEIKNLVAEKDAEIKGGAGKITVEGGMLRDLDLEMGVGELNLTSKLSGNADLDMGVGKTTVKLLGEQDDYTIDLDKGLGSLTVAGEELSGEKTIGSGPDKLDVDGGIGAINIDFVN